MDGKSAILAAEAAELAYQCETEIADRFKHYEYIDIEAVQGFVAREGDTVIICFRGTDAKRDWIYNLNAKKMNPAGMPGKVHKGFNRAMQLVVGEVVTAYGKVKDESTTKVIITGHSFGAAIALLYAARMFHDNGVSPTIHLFGCPRVGNKTFGKWFDTVFACCYRWVKNNDIVPRTPFALWGWVFKFFPFLRFMPMGFRHVGRFCYLDHSGKRRPDITKLELFKDRLAGRILHAGKSMTDGLSDHDMGDYRKDVTKNMKGK